MISREAVDPGGAEVRVIDGRAWVLAVGPVHAARAAGIAALMNELSDRPSLRRVSVDLTCALPADAAAAATLAWVALGAGPQVDVVGTGWLGRLLGSRSAA